jgi:hypothetical protein
VLGESILPLSTILIFDIGVVLTVWHFFVFRVILTCHCKAECSKVVLYLTL